MNSKCLLKVAAVSFKYGESPLVLHEVSIEVSEGEICAILGPNGSGKTTLLKLICGLEKPTDGQILIRDRALSTWGVAELARVITYVPSELHSEFPMTAREVVSLGRDAQSMSRAGFGLTPPQKDLEKVQEALFQCGCADLADRLIQELSHGQRQLIAMARAVAQGTKIIAIDETFSKMDIHHQVEMGLLLDKLASFGKTILWVVHDFNLALSRAHTCVLMKSGKKVGYGVVSEVLSEPKLSMLYPSLKFSFTKNPLDGKKQLFFGSEKTR